MDDHKNILVGLGYTAIFTMGAGCLALIYGGYIHLIQDNPITKVETMSDSNKVTYMEGFLSRQKSFQIAIEPIETKGREIYIPKELQEQIQNAATRSPLKNDQNKIVRPNFEKTKISNISQLGCAISGEGILIDTTMDPKTLVQNPSKIPTTPWTAYIKF